jgi:hypothetical protein
LRSVCRSLKSIVIYCVEFADGLWSEAWPTSVRRRLEIRLEGLRLGYGAGARSSRASTPSPARRPDHRRARRLGRWQVHGAQVHPAALAAHLRPTG